MNNKNPRQDVYVINILIFIYIYQNYIILEENIIIVTLSTGVDS